MNFLCGNRIKSPCKDCAFRQADCHCDCEAYKKFKAEVAEAQEKYKAAAHNKSLEGYIRDNRKKYLHRKGLKEKQGRPRT